MSNVLKMLSRGGAAAAETDPNFKQTVLLLHGDGTNGAQNNTFLDSSTNNFTITRNGNTTQGTFSPFSVGAGEWSNYFDGNGDNLLYTGGSSINFGTNDFTIELWAYLTNTGTNSAFLRPDDSGAFPEFGYNFSTGQLKFDARNAPIVAVTTTMPTNQWVHVVACRSGTDLRLFINGTQVGTTTTNSTNFGTTTGNIRIGGSSFSATHSVNGYISNFRIVKGTAVYTSNFTPPTTPLTAITNTSLLTCQSNRFVDNSTNAFAITPNGDVRVTPFSPFAPSAAYDPAVNGGSVYFSGGNDNYLQIGDTAGLRFGTGNFTIQCWIYLNRIGVVNTIACKGAPTLTGWNFLVSSGNVLQFQDTSINISTTTTIPAFSWTHVAVVREGTGTNELKLYINGVESASATVSTNFNQTSALKIGINRANGGEMSGYIAGWKYVVGTAETITVPTAPPTGGTALLNFTNAGIFDNTGKNNLETVGNAQIDTTTKKFGTGSLEFDGTGDYLAFVSNPDTTLGTGDLTIEGWFNSNSISTLQTIIERRAALTARGIAIFLETSALKIRAGDTTTTAWEVTIDSGTLSSSTWYHFAVTRSGNTWRGFLDGTQIGSSVTWSGTVVDETSTWLIGAAFGGGAGMNGYIDDLRITKGVARYTANFTVPTKEFPDQ